MKNARDNERISSFDQSFDSRTYSVLHNQQSFWHECLEHIQSVSLWVYKFKDAILNSIGNN
jgi:hypothetical protein